VAAGVVVAWGDSDIDKPDSELHRRLDIGVHDHDGYLSVDTGKLTTAPLFAAKVADVLGTQRPRPR
jgi:glycerol-3-phosphate dehydrogenase